MSTWKERQRQAEQALCPVAEEFDKRARRVTALMLYAGGTEGCKQEARDYLATVVEELRPKVIVPHIVSLWSKHRCLEDVYRDWLWLAIFI